MVRFCHGRVKDTIAAALMLSLLAAMASPAQAYITTFNYNPRSSPELVSIVGDRLAFGYKDGATLQFEMTCSNPVPTLQLLVVSLEQHNSVRLFATCSDLH